MSVDPGIIFELQWKKKPGGNNREDVASIGIWDTPDSSLDWMTFKSYVCQNLGTTEDIYVAYIDSDGDELPIESECEFQEALKFARQRANKGKEVVLKVDKRGCQMFTPPSSEQKHKGVASSKMSDSEKDIKKKQSKSSTKIISKTKTGDKIRVSMAQSSLSGVEEKKSKSEDHSSISHELGKKLACIMKLEPEKRKKVKVDKDKEDNPPLWFKKYMQKFKSEVVAEVTTNVMYNTRQILEIAKLNTQSSCSTCCCERSSGSMAASKPKKKKSSDDESSDCALSSDQRDQKLLKKIEKLHKREKKLEKKLDSKLEKLENKTKRRMEKKIQSKSCTEQPSEKKACSSSRKRVSDVPVYLMDAIPLNDGPKSAEVHIKLGESYTKVWEIINNGTLPWTDKTELRLAWGTSGLEPEATILKCPILMPGEKGEIAVIFRAPEFPGTFESYWHFYHMGDRFGHWLGCAVIVDSKESEKPTNDACNISFCNKDSIDGISEDREECKTKIDQPVDLRMKCEPEQTLNSSAPKSDVEDKKGSETASLDTRKRNAEYESDSDDENLSVICGTISLTSDSEEDENFVVVPMPACFMCDVPLEKTGNNPDEVKEKTKKDLAEDEVSASLNETSNNMKPDDSSAMNSDHKTSNDYHIDSEIKNETHVYDDLSLNRETHIHEEPECISNSGIVYAADMNGHCMPVSYILGSHSSHKKRDSGTQNIPENDSKSIPKQEKKEESKSSHSDRASFHCHTHANTGSGPFHMSFSTGQFNGNGNGHAHGTTAFSQANSSSSTNGFQHNESRTSSTNSSSTNQTHDPRATAAAVHILPETLVTGAINVASQAITTARAVLNNLRSNRPSEEFGDWHWSESAAEWAAQSDRSTTESLKILLEMGFTNKILNVLLLQRYDNDITKVVAELLTYKDNPGFIYNRQTQ